MADRVAQQGPLSEESRSVWTERRSMALAVLQRSWTVAAVVSRRGTKIAWRAIVRAFGRRHKGWRPFAAQQVRLGLEELGPTFVKMGQLLATRSDLVPPSLQHELSLLRDHTLPIPTDTVTAELDQIARSKVSDVFAAFDLTPVASASVGQVHRATLVDGREVAVKIRRPGIRPEIEVDITILTALARVVRLSRRVRRYDPTAIVDEFSAMLRGETDFKAEAGNIEAVGRTFVDDAKVSVPAVVRDLTRESILVMDWLDGVSLTDAGGLQTRGVDRTAMAQTIIHAYAKMIVKSDRFHADPHPGNLIAMSGGRLGLVDFGEIGTVTPATRTALASLLMAVVSRDRDALAEAVLSISRVCRPVDRTGFSQQLGDLLDPIVGSELQHIKLGRVLRGLLHVLREQGLLLPPELAVLVKTVIECESTADELDPTLSVIGFLGELGSLG